MSSPAELMALGLSSFLANRIGAEVATAVTAAGTNQATATALTAAFVEIGTAGASTGVMLQSFPDVFVIYNGGANTVAVFPPVGSYMNGSQNASFSVTNAKTAIFFRSGVRYIGVLSA